MLKKILALVLAAGMSLQVSAAKTVIKKGDGAVNMTDKVDEVQVELVDINSEEYKEQSPREEITQFAIDLFRKNYKQEENVLLSPLSIISALGMTANGAEEETLSQMEKVFHTDIQTLNQFLNAYVEQLKADKFNKVSLANSIWIRDDESLKMKRKFLETCRSSYDSEVYKAVFDSRTKDEINEWVKKNTDDMIPGILNEDPSEDTIIYLINALAFDGKWNEPYWDTQISEEDFTTEAGEKQKTDMMYSEENVYLETDNAVGFSKSYIGGNYRFVALLPNEGISMVEFVQSLDGEKLTKLLDDKVYHPVLTKLPKFSTEYSQNLAEQLQELGMTDAFDSGKADFSAMVRSNNGSICISDVIHKAKIELNEVGTKAAAATVVEMCVEEALLEDENKPAPKKVYLDRPFFYMIVDTSQNLPLFMGTMMDVEK